MSKVLQIDYVVIKSFNNNIVLVENDNTEKILFGKGIGFSKKVGDKILSGTKVDKIFNIEDGENIKNFKTIIERNSEELLAICEECIAEIAEAIDEEIDENIHIGLIDHISFALKRIKNNEFMENPFLIETENLYPLEFRLAKQVVKKLESYANMSIPEGEAGFIAIHIHSARNKGKLSNTMKYNFIASKSADLIERRMNITLDRKSLEYARFVTHLRYACERIINGQVTINDLLVTIKRKYKVSFKVASEIGMMMEKLIGIKIPQDEIGYLAIHIERFKLIEEEAM